MDLSGFSFLKFVSRTLGPGGSKKTGGVSVSPSGLN
jgi:hypothetical protein